MDFAVLAGVSDACVKKDLRIVYTPVEEPSVPTGHRNNCALPESVRTRDWRE